MDVRFHSHDGWRRRQLAAWPALAQPYAPSAEIAKRCWWSGPLAAVLGETDQHCTTRCATRYVVAHSSAFKLVGVTQCSWTT